MSHIFAHQARFGVRKLACALDSEKPKENTRLKKEKLSGQLNSVNCIGQSLIFV